MALLRSHLPRRFMTIYAALFFFIISLTVWLSYLSSKASLEEELNKTNLALLNLIQQKVEMVLREIDTNTIHFIQEPELAHFLNGRSINDDTKYNNFRILNEKIKNLMYANSNIASIYLYSVDNKTLLTDSMYSDESEFNDMGWFEAFSAMNRYQKWIGSGLCRQSGIPLLQDRISSADRPPDPLLPPDCTATRFAMNRTPR